MSYEFQNTLHQSPGQMCAAIAYEWMTAGGANKPAYVDEMVAQTTPAAEAASCIDGWDLHAEWLKDRDTTPDDIVAAFSEFFASRPDKS